MTLFNMAGGSNHAQNKLRVLLVAILSDYNILWYFWSLIVYPLSVICTVDLFTFFIQSVMFTNRVSPPTETLTLFCAWLREWLIEVGLYPEEQITAFVLSDKKDTFLLFLDASSESIAFLYFLVCTDLTGNDLTKPSIFNPIWIFRVAIIPSINIWFKLQCNF